jgi:hypothetical protein
MDPVTIASAALAILGPYLAKAGGKFAEKAGETLAEQAEDLYQLIKRRFASDAYAEQTLTRAEQQPESEGRLAAVQEVLADKMNEDPDFAEAVRRIVDQVNSKHNIPSVTASGERSVATGGDISGGTLVTGNNNEIGRPS